MRRLLLCLLSVAGLAGGAALASGRLLAAPAAPGTLHAASNRLALFAPAQFMYLGRPYCWYPYGWAGAGWYWCGYGTRVGLTANDTSRRFIPGNRQKPLASAAS